MMDPIMHEFLRSLGFAAIAPDRDAPGHHLYALLPAIQISVPEKGCVTSDIIKLVWHAGAAAARKEIAAKHQEFLKSFL
jgi:hypothetical protein